MINNISDLGFYSVPLLTQSIPGLLISLGGLIMTGSALAQASQNTSLDGIPILLQTNCILAFKGNIELIFALYLSSLSQSSVFSYKKYFRYIFDNSNLVIAQSAVIGLVIGLLGIISNLLIGETDTGINVVVLTASLISCIISSILFIMLLVTSIEASKLFEINPDNIILPTISSLGDYINVRTLIYLATWLKTIPIPSCLAYLLVSSSIIPFCLCFALISKKRLPLQSIEVLLTTYAISTISGYVLESFRKVFPILTPSFPVFSGMSVSIAFIYLHKIFTSINNQTVHNSKESHATLVLISILMSAIYLAASSIMGLNYPYCFYILFTLFFIVQVTILLKAVTFLIEYLDKYEDDTGVLALPLITSISDVLATIFLLTISVILLILNTNNTIY
ncbi:hypothetical protein M896_040830 [Ordospora colligata OC4]|uniref:SLC41A/MgtE integral membrane domain-containing protein n=1 Tax=Ordospora colligata OC4 TaxID=1354746 RepID=A0A0B2UKK5_9MICR|nr:uncharacterized protein M896_040830 [Ordospora colligata OC4]KHN69888.1 hypothetical protein M896_040830 [Ordospora colligata OC4]TBU16058.1 hypothetical protein CWI41_040830 [Ordospora colligata]